MLAPATAPEAAAGAGLHNKVAPATTRQRAATGRRRPRASGIGGSFWMRENVFQHMAGTPSREREHRTRDEPWTMSDMEDGSAKRTGRRVPAPGGRRPPATLHDVAREAGVSQAT